MHVHRAMAEPIGNSDRRSAGRRVNDAKPPVWPIAGVGIAVLAQFAAMIWWGATLTSAVGALRDTIAEFRGGLIIVSSQLSSQAVKMGVLETKVDALQDKQSSRR